MMMVQYLLDRNQRARSPGSTRRRRSSSTPSSRSTLALEQERTVDEADLGTRWASPDGESDYVAEEFLQWFLKEQLEEESSMSDLLDTVERASETNILLAEAFLARERVAIGPGRSERPRRGRRSTVRRAPQRRPAGRRRIELRGVPAAAPTARREVVDAQLDQVGVPRASPSRPRPRRERVERLGPAGHLTAEDAQRHAGLGACRRDAAGYLAL